MIDDCNINNLATNQVSAVFNSRAIRRSVSVIEFCYKSVSLEELKNIKIILFPMLKPVQMAKFPEISHFFNQLGRHVNAASRKSLEIQA